MTVNILRHSEPTKWVKNLFCSKQIWFLLHTFKSFIQFCYSQNFHSLFRCYFGLGSRCSHGVLRKICLRFPSRKTEIAGWVLTQQKKFIKTKILRLKPQYDGKYSTSFWTHEVGEESICEAIKSPRNEG